MIEVLAQALRDRRAQLLVDWSRPAWHIGCKAPGSMGVVTIITFFIMLPVVAIMLGPFNFGFWESVAMASFALLGGGGLLGTLYLLEPERREREQH